MTYAATVTVPIPGRGILAIGDVFFYMVAAIVYLADSSDRAWLSLKRFYHVVQHDSSKLMETVVALFCLLPACWMFPVPDRIPRQWDTLLADVMPLPVYGIILLSTGIAIIVGLHFELNWLRRWSQFTAGCVWSFLLIFFLAEFPHFLLVSMIPPVIGMAIRSWWYVGRRIDGQPDGLSASRK